MNSDFKIAMKHTLVYLLKVIIAAIVIGLLYKEQTLVTIILGLRIAYRINKYRVDKQNVVIPVIGMLVTGTLGTVIEYYGTKFGYWEYHDINTQLPKYLFFVWMLAFTFMYNLETKIFKSLSKPTRSKKLMYIFAIVLVFPTVGEIITIYFGVWTYYFPYKFWGVSPHTIVSIAMVHLLVNYVISIYCKKRLIKDVVLNPS